MRLLFVFSGLAGATGPPLAQLRELSARPENTRFFSTTIDAVQAALDYAGPDAYREQLPDGIPLADWLAGATPEPGTLRHSIVEGICAHLYQLCLLQPRPPAGESEPAPVAAVGHSLGIQAAVAGALRLRSRREFIEFCYHSMVLATMILLRCHQVPGCERADDALTERYLTESGGTATPGTMASIMAVDLDPLRDAVAASQGAGAVEIAIVNSRRSYVLAGSPRALVEFWFGHGRRLVEGGARWSFLPTTAPFHSSLLEPAVRLLRADSAFIGYDITGPQLALPVYVAESPHNLQDRPSSFGAFLEQAISRPVDWFATVTEAVDRTRPDHLLDFGPGPAARVFARECLQQIGYGLRYRTLSHSRRR